MGDTAKTRNVALGMIGCGMISHFHAAAARDCDDRHLRFAASADVNLEAARSFATRYGCTGAYDDMLQMVASEMLDGVVLATWPTQHFDHVKQLVEAGMRHILIEKPITVRASDAYDLWRFAGERAATIVEGWMFRHHPVMQELRRLVLAGELGRVDSILSSYQGWDPEAATPEAAERNWRQKRDLGGGVAYDLTSYSALACTDLAQSLPKRVAFTGAWSKYETLVRLHGHVEYENGIVALIKSSKRALMTRNMEVNGEAGCATVGLAFGPQIPWDAGVERRSIHDPMNQVVECWRPRDGEGRPVDLDPGVAQQRQIANFADVIRGVAAPKVSLTESVVNVYLVEAMVQSAEERRMVDVVLPEDLAQVWQARPI